jgi:hypothetical protein
MQNKEDLNEAVMVQLVTSWSSIREMGVRASTRAIFFVIYHEFYHFIPLFIYNSSNK